MWNFERVLDAITNAGIYIIETAINDSKNWCLQQR